MPINDPFDEFQTGLTSPITNGFDIAPDDSSDLVTLPRAVMVTGGGDISAVLKDGGTVTLPGLSPGVLYPIRPRRIFATGTSATGIKGLY